MLGVDSTPQERLNPVFDPERFGSFLILKSAIGVGSPQVLNELFEVCAAQFDCVPKDYPPDSILEAMQIGKYGWGR